MKPQIVLNPINKHINKFYSAIGVSLIGEVATNRQAATIVDFLERKMIHMPKSMLLEFSPSYSELGRILSV